MNPRLLTATLLALAGLVRLSAAAVSEPKLFTGMCNASAVVMLDERHFAVANDEDSRLRIYDLQQPGPPLAAPDFAAFLKLAPKQPETDLEAAARVGDLVFWLTSHGRNTDGKERPNRRRLFAARLTNRNGQPVLEPVGQPCRTLLEEMLAEPCLARLGLAAAMQPAARPPRTVEIEGLAATPQGGLLVGFRSPIRGREAFVVPLENPREVIAGERARFGDPLLLGLGGRGIRDFVLVGTNYFILAGPTNGGGSFRLYTWPGGDAPAKHIKSVSFAGLHPEAITPLLPGDATRLLVLSDDGKYQIDGCPCGELTDPARRRFRAVVVTP
jgi:hypothetical protein